SLLIIWRPPTSPLFPYTTLFRSRPAQALHPRLAGGHYRGAGPPVDPPGPRVRRERGQDPRSLDDHRRRRGESLVPHGHDLSRPEDRKSTRLNSSHVKISYAVFCL